MGKASLLGTPASSGANNQYLDSKGYYRFLGTNKLVHRVVYFACHPTGNPKWHVHHIDGYKTNNAIENLILLRPGVHRALHDKWSMKSLPNREKLLDWLCGKQKKERNRYRRKKATKEERAIRRATMLEARLRRHDLQEKIKKRELERRKEISGTKFIVRRKKNNQPVSTRIGVKHLSKI